MQFFVRFTESLLGSRSNVAWNVFKKDIIGTLTLTEEILDSKSIFEHARGMKTKNIWYTKIQNNITHKNDL